MVFFLYLPILRQVLWIYLQLKHFSPGFSFPYLYDESQDIAKNYGAVCTPDFFGYDEDLVLRYRGRLDASRKETAPENSERELFEAMKIIASHKKGPENQMASMGCSIKWKEEK